MNASQKEQAGTAFLAAVKKAKNQVGLGMILGCSQSRISRIISGDSDCEAVMAVEIEKRLGIPRYDLRPDLFDKPARAKRYPYENLLPADVQLRQHGVKLPKNANRRRGGAAASRSKPAKK